jgi:hypothetical protein
MVLGDTTYYNMIIHDSPASQTMDGLKKRSHFGIPGQEEGCTCQFVHRKVRFGTETLEMPKAPSYGKFIGNMLMNPGI